MNKVRSLVALASIAAGCQAASNPLAVSSLDRPGAIAFACYSESESAFRMALSDCVGVTGASTEDLRIISFLVETTRGEIAAVDWQDERAVDSDRTVPGYTFVRVGEAPTDVLVPENDSRMTFVANYGSYSVQGLVTADFVPDAVRDPALVASTVLLASGPTDLAYVETAGARHLFAALPHDGAIAHMFVAPDGSLGTPTYLTVSATIPVAVPAAGGATYERLCPADTFAREASVAPRAPVSRGVTPAPARLAVIDLGGGAFELVATDESLPMLHRFTVDDLGATEAASIATGVPTLDVVATPLVPADFADAVTATAATERYLYAIDAIDRSVLAVDAATGAVLPVNVGDEAADRVPLLSQATHLAVLTPSYDLAADPALGLRCNPADAASDRPESARTTMLHGVFLGVGTLDGTLTFVDVFDLDAPCRGPLDCGGAGNANDTFVSVRRHRPRGASFVNVTPAVSSSIVFSYQGDAGRLAPTGAASSGTGPGLLPVDDGDAATAYCPGTSYVPGRGQMRPALTATGATDVEGQPLICLLDDPSSVRGQRWVATFESVLPASQGLRGRLVSAAGTPTFETEDAAFCRWGTLGSADLVASGLAATDPEFGYGGDMLVVTGLPAPERQDDPACETLLDEASGRRIRVAFSIVEAYQGRLVLGDFVPDGGYTLPSVLNANPSAAFDLVRSCIPDFTTYEVRARNAYVVGSTDGLARHRVVAGAGDRCQVDVAGQPYDPASPDTARTFRALGGRTFVHPQVAFRISDFVVPSGVTAQLVFDVVFTTSPLRIDGGALTTHSAYNPADARYYIVDSSGRQVLQYGLQPLTRIDLVR